MLRRLRTVFRKWSSGRDHSRPDTSGQSTEDDRVLPPGTERTPVEALLERDHISKNEMVLEAGIEPADFVVQVVRREGGRMFQKELVEALGWDKTTMSRFLGELEGDGTIERVRVGRKKLVMHPEAVPDICAEPEPADPFSERDTDTPPTEV
jgi:hypothetical protein